MYCFRCGKEIPDDSTFCPFCGADQSAFPPVEEAPGKAGAPQDAKGSPPQEPAPVEPEAPARPPSRGGIGSLVKWIAAIVVVVLLLGLVASPSLSKNMPGLGDIGSLTSLIPGLGGEPTFAPATTPGGQAQPSPTGTPLSTGQRSPPNVAFTGNPTAGTGPLTVTFTDTSGNSPTSWVWDFGDGSKATQKNPQHVYSTAGTYSVTLKATNAAGSNSLQKPGYITVSGPRTTPTTQAPVTTQVSLTASFSGSPLSGTVPLEVSFADDSAGSPTSWRWDFGDGGSSTERNPTHRYQSAGSYTVTLLVRNSQGSDEWTRAGYVTATAPVTTAPPTTPETPRPELVPDWEYVPTSGPAPLTVHFYDYSEGSPTNWHWTFGDGTSSTEQNPVHTYAAPGSYTIGFSIGTIWDSIGNANIGTVVVTAPGTTAPALSPPTAHLFYEPNMGSAPLEVYFSDLSTGSPQGWLWLFGDGESSMEQNPGHTYTSPGEYYVTLVVANDAGASTEERGPIVVTA